MTADQYSQYQRYIAGMTEEQRAAYDLQLVQYYQKWHIPRSRSGTLVSGQTVRINYKTQKCRVNCFVDILEEQVCFSNEQRVSRIAQARLRARCVEPDVSSDALRRAATSRAQGGRSDVGRRDVLARRRWRHHPTDDRRRLALPTKTSQTRIKCGRQTAVVAVERASCASTELSPLAHARAQIDCAVCFIRFVYFGTVTHLQSIYFFNATNVNLISMHESNYGF